MALSIQEVRGAVARGWCDEKNAHKEMDGHLAEAISQEVWKLTGAEQARRDIRILLANLRALEEVTGETLEGEDAEIVAAIERDYQIAL